MKAIAGMVFTLMMSATVSEAQAQVAPGTAPTASLLQWDPAGFSLNFSELKEVAGLSLNFSDPKDLAGFSLNFRPVAEMLQQLKARGASIDASVSQDDGFALLNLVVDGKKVAPIVIECRTCAKIVFEY